MAKIEPNLSVNAIFLPANQKGALAGSPTWKRRTHSQKKEEGSSTLNLISALKFRPFAFLWAGQTTSRLGDSLYRIALAWWVLQKTGSAAEMGAVLVFGSVPMLIFLLIGGVATDRFPRLRVMLISDILRGAVVALVALLAYTGQLEVVHIYIASVFFGLVAAFFQPAYTATVPEITPPELLPSANSLTSLSQQGASVIGPAIAAGIIAMGGTTTAFAFNALSFFLSAACILPIFSSEPALNLPPSSPRTDPSQKLSVVSSIRQVFGDIREGLVAVAASPWLWVTILLFGFINAASAGPMSTSLPILVKDVLQQDVAVLGLFTSMSSAGYVLGAIGLGRLTKIRKRGYLAYISTILNGAAIAVFGLTRSIPLLAAVALLNGASMSVFGLIWTNSLQELVPRGLLGRVAAIDSLGSFVLLPIGFAVAGWATDQIGAPQVFLIGGALSMALAGIGLLHPDIRALD
jgi:DHA3 family tetracycline resistance protein-like MFS transporter